MSRIVDAVTTADGICPVHLFTPDTGDAGPWPGVVMYPDSGGLRDTIDRMAAKLAGFGYAVLVPDVYYRHGEWARFDMATVFGDPVERPRLMSMIHSVTADMMAADARAFFDYLAARPEVRGKRFGVCGYCTGGRNALVVAGREPDRVAAAASFHGGDLATDAADSPHLLAGRIAAAVYVAGATNDPAFTDEQAATLERALTAAGVAHTVEIYPAEHGFALPDVPAYQPAADDRHWAALRDLFATELSG